VRIHTGNSAELGALRSRRAAADQFGICQTLPDNLTDCKVKSIGIVHILPVIETECLFVNVAEQMVWLNAHIGPIDPALEQAPKVFHPICVNLPIDVSYGVVNNLVNKLAIQSFIGLQRIAVERGTGDQMLKGTPTTTGICRLIYDASVL
jgi:hypothetical protein